MGDSSVSFRSGIFGAREKEEDDEEGRGGAGPVSRYWEI